MQELVLRHAREAPEVRTTGVGRGRKGRGGDNLPYLPEESFLVPGQLRALQRVRVRACSACVRVCVRACAQSARIASVGALRTCACMCAHMCVRAHLQALIPVGTRHLYWGDVFRCRKQAGSPSSIALKHILKMRTKRRQRKKGRERERGKEEGRGREKKEKERKERGKEGGRIKRERRRTDRKGETGKERKQSEQAAGARPK